MLAIQSVCDRQPFTTTRRGELPGLVCEVVGARNDEVVVDANACDVVEVDDDEDNLECEAVVVAGFAEVIVEAVVIRRFEVEAISELHVVVIEAAVVATVDCAMEVVAWIAQAQAAEPQLQQLLPPGQSCGGLICKGLQQAKSPA